MTSIDITLVEKIADLSRLQISSEEATQYTGALQEIFDLFNTLQKADLSNMEPLSNGLEAPLPLRSDTIIESDQHEKLQKLAPAVTAELYWVPKVIE